MFALDEDARQVTLWKSEVGFYPQQTLITPDGRVVMINQYPGYGEKWGVVIFDDHGQVIANHTTTQLFTRQEWDAIPGNTELKPKAWVEHAFFQSIRNLVSPPAVSEQPLARQIGEWSVKNEFPLALSIQTTNGRTIWFDLQTGKKV